MKRIQIKLYEINMTVFEMNEKLHNIKCKWAKFKSELLESTREEMWEEKEKKLGLDFFQVWWKLQSHRHNMYSKFSIHLKRKQKKFHWSRAKESSKNKRQIQKSSDKKQIHHEQPCEEKLKGSPSDRRKDTIEWEWNPYKEQETLGIETAGGNTFLTVLLSLLYTILQHDMGL